MPGNPVFPHVAILGPGLLGGSLAMAVRRFMPGVGIRLWARRREPLEYAEARHLADVCSQNLPEVVDGAALVILATPTPTYLELARQFRGVLVPDALVTDVGSTKGDVHAGVGNYLHAAGHLFLGSHPMAGSEKQGIEHARAELFRSAMVVITNEHRVTEDVVQRLISFWEQLGAKTVTAEPRLHDRLVAAISHTPHLLSALTARAAVSDEALPPDALRQLASTGFRDTTRVSDGAPELWADILSQNAEAVCPHLEQSIRDLQTVLRLLREGRRAELQQWLAQAKHARDTILPPIPRTVSVPPKI